jgi:hypothetical protein
MPFPTTKLADESELIPMHQGETNACGTTSLAMILRYFLRKNIPTAELDRKIRRLDIFTSPGNLVTLGRSYGLKTEAYNRGNLLEIRSHLEQGRAVQALIRSEDGLHYVVLTGIQSQGHSGEQVVCLDPAIGKRIFVPVERFLASWGNLPGLFHNFFIVYSKDTDAIAPSRIQDVRLAIGVLDGITKCLNNAHFLFSPDDSKRRFRSIFQVLSGFFQSIFLFPFAILRIAIASLKTGRF